MAKKTGFRSPLFYVGDKYKLMAEIKTHFPDGIDTFIEPFVGGGSVFMNVQANRYVLNDLDSYVISLHRYLCNQADDPNAFLEKFMQVVDKYQMSCTYRRDVIPDDLKRQHVKTYIARYNKEGFLRLRDDYNRHYRGDCLYLYVLLIYGFNRMLRFNRNDDFNLPVGNVDFNSNTYNALQDYFRIVKQRDIQWSNMDFHSFFDNISISNGDFVYLDPPYLITFSEYNKYWNEDTERDLLAVLDILDSQGIRFAISNVTHYKGKVNQIFLDWSARYNTHSIKSNYISYHDNSIKNFNEVLVCNY